MYKSLLIKLCMTVMIEYKAVSGPQTTKQNKKIRNRKGIYLYYDNNSMDIFSSSLKPNRILKS